MFIDFKKCHCFKTQMLWAMKNLDSFHIPWYICDSLFLYFCEWFVMYALILIFNIEKSLIMCWIGHSWVSLRRWMCFWTDRSVSEWFEMSEIILSAFGVSGDKNKNAETTHKVVLLYCVFFSAFFACLWCLDCCSH